MSTLRYRAAGTIPYVLALTVLGEYVRSHSREKIDYGPTRLAFLELNGLTVTGDDLGPVDRLLAEVPGLHPSDE